MKKTITLTILTSVGALLAACSSSEKGPAGSTTTGGSGGSSGAGLTAGAGTASHVGGGGGDGSAGLSAGGAGGAAMDGPDGAPFCETQMPATLPYEITLRSGGVGVYEPNGWSPATAADDLMEVGCPSGPLQLADAGTNDAGSDAGANDAGAINVNTGDAGPAAFNSCLGIEYTQADPANAAPEVSWQLGLGPYIACFDGAMAVDFWVAGTSGDSVTFVAADGANEITVVLTSTWTKYSIDISTASLNTTGVLFPFSLKFHPEISPGPTTVYVADPTYVGN